jgi:ABC-type metal ion transport system substrate-binding protein
MSMDIVRVAYRDDDRTPVIYCIKEMGAKHYGIDVEVLKITDYVAFEASLFNDSADVLIDHVEFLYAEAAKGKRITFFCAPRIVRGLDLMVPKHVENVSEFIGKNVAVRDSGRPYAITLWLRMMGLEGKVGLQSSRMRTWEGGASGRKS